MNRNDAVWTGYQALVVGSIPLWE